MKVAVICLASLRVAAGVRMLAEYFAQADADLFVHVDAKVSCEAYEGTSLGPRMHILKERVPIYWGGFNTIIAVIKAIEFARDRADYDRYIFLTEDSVPLRSPSELERCLSEDVEWIDSNDLPNDRWQRYTRFFCFDMPSTNPRVGNPIDKFFMVEDVGKIARMQSLMAQGKASLQRLSHGSAYWALSSKAITAVLETHRHSEHLRESFEFSAMPDEQYFHTILGCAGLANKRRHFMRADFTRPPHPYVYRTAEELHAERRDSKCLFLRKVDLNKAEVSDYVSQLAAMA
jgi:hypothetical protein